MFRERESSVAAYRGAMAFTVEGTIMQTPELGRLQVRHHVAVTVDDDGSIASIEPSDEAETSRVLIPGLVDTHIHAPQWPQLGTGLDLPLERWLFDHTFPLEKRLTEASFAARVWTEMVSTCLLYTSPSPRD